LFALRRTTIVPALNVAGTTMSRIAPHFIRTRHDGEFRVNSATGKKQEYTSVAMHDINDFIVVFSGEGPGDNKGVFVRQFAGNEQPVVSVPGAESINEGNAIVFSSANSNLISFADADGDEFPFRLTIQVAAGSVSLDTSLLTVHDSSPANLVVEGTMDQLNSALDGLQYQSINNGPGAVSLNIAVDDQGHGVGNAETGNGAVGINIASINDPPVAVADTFTVTSHAAKVNSFTPISYWRLGETEGNVAIDEVGTKNGVYENSPNKGVPGITQHGDKAVEFDPEDRIRIDHDSAYLIDQGSIQLWFKTNDIGQTAGLFAKDAFNNGNGGHVRIYLEGDEVKVGLQGQTGSNTVTSGTLNSNQWYHVVFKFGPQGMKLYVNAEESGTDSYTGGLGTSSGGSGNTNPIYIGADNFRTAPTLHFDGIIDEVALFESQLNPTQIDQLYSTGRQVYVTTEDVVGVSYGVGQSVAINDFDPEGDPFVVELLSGAANGTVTLGPSGEFIYSPDENYHGVDSFTYRLVEQANPANTSGPATVQITVLPIDDPVQIAPIFTQMAEQGGEVVFSTANDNAVELSDVDGLGVLYTVNLKAGSGTFASSSGAVTISGDTATVVGTLPFAEAALEGIVFIADPANVNDVMIDIVVSPNNLPAGINPVESKLTVLVDITPGANNGGGGNTGNEGGGETGGGGQEQGAGGEESGGDEGGDDSGNEMTENEPPPEDPGDGQGETGGSGPPVDGGGTVEATQPVTGPAPITPIDDSVSITPTEELAFTLPVQQSKSGSNRSDGDLSQRDRSRGSEVAPLTVDLNVPELNIESAGPTTYDTSEYNFMTKEGEYWDELDSIQDLVDKDLSVQDFYAESALSVSTGLSIGYVLWVLRGSYLLTSLLTQMPAWRLVDPLPIFDSFDKGEMGFNDGEEEDDETLESMMERSNEL
jgi:hypothetical protein